MIRPILAIGALAFVVLMYLAVVVIHSKIRTLLGKIQNIGRPARRIHLVKKAAIAWQHPEKVRALVQPLLARGFKDAGLFEIPEMHQLRMQALVHPENGALGAVYEFPKFGVWLDLVFRFEDGGALTCTTNPGPSLEDRPGFPKVRQHEQDSVKLYERLLHEKPLDRKVAPVKIADFVPLFEKAYADEMDWRAAKGMSSNELRSTAEATGHAGASEDALDLTKTIHDAQQLRNLDESFRERFAAEQRISESAWKPKQKSVIVVHDRLPARTVVEQFEKLSKARGIQLSLPHSGESTRLQFVKLNAQIPNGKGFTKLGEVRIDPLTADVWSLPE